MIENRKLSIEQELIFRLFSLAKGRANTLHMSRELALKFPEAYSNTDELKQGAEQIIMIMEKVLDIIENGYDGL